MSSQQTIPRTHEAPEAFLTGPDPAPPKSNRFGRFFVWLFLIPAVLYLGAIPLVRLPSYERWGPSHWGPQLDFAFNTQGQNADVVIFGDSSAFLGVDPRLVNRQLAIKSLVLPNTVGSLPVNGDRALEFYLAHNRRPRLIVLYFTAWDLDYSKEVNDHLFEGEEMMLRHGSLKQIARFALAHPLELPAFPLRNFTSVGTHWLKTLLHHEDRTRETAEALGHVDDEEEYPAMLEPCELPKRLSRERADATVRGLAEKYRARGYDVAVYLAPMPHCDNTSGFAGNSFGGLALAPAATLPAGDFKQDGFYAHMEPAAVPEASRLFAKVIATKLGK
jgi:hypothetical protein